MAKNSRAAPEYIQNMDQAYRGIPGDSIVITGIGISAAENLRIFLMGGSSDLSQANLVHDCRPVQYLRQKKTLKFMSKQDRLALESASLAVDMSKIPPQILRDNAGVFLTVGYIPFEIDVAAELCDGSMEDNQFSMRKFASDAIENINPLLTFACLPNMPAHHVALNLEILGRYLITYPDCIQMYIACQEAIWQLREGQIDLALVGGVADQSNFLVRHHYKKIPNQSSAMPLADCAGFITLEKGSVAMKRHAKILAQLESLAITRAIPGEDNKSNHNGEVCLGPAELILRIFSFLNMDSTECNHCFYNGSMLGTSRWRKAE